MGLVLLIALFLTNFEANKRTQSLIQSEAKDVSKLQSDIRALQDELKNLSTKDANTNTSSTPTKSEAVQDVTVYSNSIYGFKLITSSDCQSQFSLKEEKINKETGELLSLGVYLPSSKEYKSVWYYYSVMSEKVYNSIPANEPPGQPEIVAPPLKNGFLLTKYDPQDAPEDLVFSCKLSVITF